MAEVEGELQRQRQPAAEIAERPAARRHSVPLVRWVRRAETLANRARLIGSDRYKTARFAAIGATGIQLPTSTADAKPAWPSVVYTALYSGRCHLCHARDQIHEFGGPDVLRWASTMTGCLQ